MNEIKGNLNGKLKEEGRILRFETNEVIEEADRTHVKIDSLDLKVNLLVDPCAEDNC